MKKAFTLSIAILTIFIHTSFSQGVTPKKNVAKVNLNHLYQLSISDAMVADSSEICDTLWPINHNNPKLVWKTIDNEEYVLVGNFNKFPNSYSGSSVKNSWGILWVFIPNQFKSKVTSIQNNDTLLRIRQLLGLPPNNDNKYIVELWVKPKDMFRPAADSEIDDRTAGPYYPNNTDTTYRKWFNQNIYDSYFSNGTLFPWTRLGYSYDWAKSASEVGVSEYCIKINSILFVEKLCLATKYLAH